MIADNAEYRKRTKGKRQVIVIVSPLISRPQKTAVAKNNMVLYPREQFFAESRNDFSFGYF
jgi:hypothetical protein